MVPQGLDGIEIGGADGGVDAEDDSDTDGDAKASATDRAKCEPMLVECLADIFRVICSGASMGISTVSKPHFLNLGKRLVDFVVNGEVNRKELMRNLIMWNGDARQRTGEGQRNPHDRL
jgi:hypothetical protein